MHPAEINLCDCGHGPGGRHRDVRDAVAGYDAGRERERLFRVLAAWTAAGFVPRQRAERFYRRVGVLARRTGVPFETILTDLRAEAEGVG